MTKIFKIFTAMVLISSLCVATVICCCIAPAVMAHLHKVVSCSHCPSSNSHHHSSNPADVCLSQLTSAEFVQMQTIDFTKHLGNAFPLPLFVDKYITTLPPSRILAYSPGSPPLRISFIPLFLRTFNLRV